MSTTTRYLSLGFVDTNAERYTQTWRNIKATPTLNEIKAFATAIISNGSVFQKTPSELQTATVTQTTTTPIDISD